MTLVSHGSRILQIKIRFPRCGFAQESPFLPFTFSGDAQKEATSPVLYICMCKQYSSVSLISLRNVYLEPVSAIEEDYCLRYRRMKSANMNGFSLFYFVRKFCLLYKTYIVYLIYLYSLYYKLKNYISFRMLVF